MPLDELPDELLVAVASFLAAPHDLLDFSAACRRTSALPTNHLWRALCAQRWAPWPRYELTTDREAWLAVQHAGLDWRARYRHFEADAARTLITLDEMRGLSWHFNFTAAAGGRDLSSSSH